jgi:hypothetical protein
MKPSIFLATSPQIPYLHFFPSDSLSSLSNPFTRLYSLATIWDRTIGVHLVACQDFSEIRPQVSLGRRTFSHISEAAFCALEVTCQVSFHSLPLQHGSSTPSNNLDMTDIFQPLDPQQSFHQTLSHTSDRFSSFRTTS